MPLPLPIVVREGCVVTKCCPIVFTGGELMEAPKELFRGGELQSYLNCQLSSNYPHDLRVKELITGGCSLI